MKKELIIRVCLVLFSLLPAAEFIYENIKPFISQLQAAQ